MTMKASESEPTPANGEVEITSTPSGVPQPVTPEPLTELASLSDTQRAFVELLRSKLGPDYEPSEYALRRIARAEARILCVRGILRTW
ncbi:MAG: hypothetical protein JWP13_33 [Candidatus Saccharibacteria bacterium]|nr:hypothetical protein [Candidatus Saccharibacteria bacterium]